MDIINWKKFLQPYEQCVDELMVKFEGLKKSFSIDLHHSPIEHIDGRVKKIGSILEKAKRKNIDYTKIQDEIDDIAGIRILCKFVEDIEIVVDEIKKRVGYDIKIITERDYIKKPKPSGYKSYHIILEYKLITVDGIKNVRAEIQIRTLAMNFWATLEHSLNYKYNNKLPEDVKTRLISVAEASSSLDNEMSQIREEVLETIEESNIRNGLVDEILGRIETLYYNVKIENASELNKNFFELYENGTTAELIQFNERIKLIAKLYNEE